MPDGGDGLVADEGQGVVACVSSGCGQFAEIFSVRENNVLLTGGPQGLLRHAEVGEQLYDVNSRAEREEEGSVPAYAGDDLHGDDDVPVVLDHLLESGEGGHFAGEDGGGAEEPGEGRRGPAGCVVTGEGRELGRGEDPGTGVSVKCLKGWEGSVPGPPESQVVTSDSSDQHSALKDRKYYGEVRRGPGGES